MELFWFFVCFSYFAGSRSDTGIRKEARAARAPAAQLIKWLRGANLSRGGVGEEQPAALTAPETPG